MYCSFVSFLFCFVFFLMQSLKKMRWKWQSYAKLKWIVKGNKTAFAQRARWEERKLKSVYYCHDKLWVSFCCCCFFYIPHYNPVYKITCKSINLDKKKNCWKCLGRSASRIHISFTGSLIQFLFSFMSKHFVQLLNQRKQ